MSDVTRKCDNCKHRSEWRAEIFGRGPQKTIVADCLHPVWPDWWKERGERPVVFPGAGTACEKFEPRRDSNQGEIAMPDTHNALAELEEFVDFCAHLYDDSRPGYEQASALYEVHCFARRLVSEREARAALASAPAVEPAPIDEEHEFREWIRGIDSRNITARNAWNARATLAKIAVGGYLGKMPLAERDAKMAAVIDSIQTATYAEGRKDEREEVARLLAEEAAAMRREGQGCTDARYDWMAAGIEAAADALRGIDSATGKPATPELMARLLSTDETAAPAVGEVPEPRTDGAPPEIWLQLHGDGEPDGKPVDYTNDASWCWHQVFKNDVRYVLAAPPAATAPVPSPVERLNQWAEKNHVRFVGRSHGLQSTDTISREALLELAAPVPSDSSLGVPASASGVSPTSAERDQ